MQYGGGALGGMSTRPTNHAGALKGRQGSVLEARAPMPLELCLHPFHVNGLAAAAHRPRGMLDRFELKHVSFRGSTGGGASRATDGPDADVEAEPLTNLPAGGHGLAINAVRRKRAELPGIRVVARGSAQAVSVYWGVAIKDSIPKSAPTGADESKRLGRKIAEAFDEQVV